MFDFKKQIRDVLYEMKTLRIENEEPETSGIKIDDKGWSNIQDELEFYRSKLPEFTFENSPDIEQKAFALKKQLSRLIDQNIQMIDLNLNNRNPNWDVLDVGEIEQISKKFATLNNRSDKGLERNKDKEPEQPEDDGKETEEAKPEAPDGSSVDMADALASKYLARTGMGGVAVKTIRGMTDSDGKPYGADTKSRERQVKRHPPGSIYNFKGTDHVIAYYKDNGQAMGFIDTPENEKSLKKMKNLLTSIAADLKKGSMKEEKYDKILSLIDEQMDEVWREVSESNK